jgi:hypothetical protein
MLCNIFVFIKIIFVIFFDIINYDFVFLIFNNNLSNHFSKFDAQDEVVRKLREFATKKEVINIYTLYVYIIYIFDLI